MFCCPTINITSYLELHTDVIGFGLSMFLTHNGLVLSLIMASDGYHETLASNTLTTATYFIHNIQSCLFLLMTPVYALNMCMHGPWALKCSLFELVIGRMNHLGHAPSSMTSPAEIDCDKQLTVHSE